MFRVMPKVPCKTFIGRLEHSGRYPFKSIVQPPPTLPFLPWVTQSNPILEWPYLISIQQHKTSHNLINGMMTTTTFHPHIIFDDWITLTQSPFPVSLLYTIHYILYTRYFPSYTLGAMMAAQLFETAEKAIPDLRGKIAKGNVPFTISSDSCISLRDTG